MANPSSPAIPAAKSPENAITSLTSSFSAVPPPAVPAVIDCVLASSSLFPSLLFSSLLRSFPDPKEATQKNHILSYATALCHLVKSTDAPMDALRDFVWSFFVPVMKAIDPNDCELLNQIEETLFDVVSMMRAWELMGETLVPYCLRSVGLSIGMVQNDDLAMYQWSTEDSLEMHGTLILPIACRILTFMLQCVLTSGVGVPNVRQKLEGFAANLLWDLSNLAVGMLVRPMEDRSFSIRLLLPSLFKWLTLFCSVEVLVRGSPYRLSRLSFAKDIWKCCISLFSFGDLERRDAFNILSLYLSSFYNQQLYKNVERYNISIDFDITTEKEFWEETRRGMVDGDATLRKQALYILKLALNNPSSYSSRSDGQSTASAKADQTISCNGTSEHSNVTKKGKWAEKEAKSLGVGEVCCSGEHCLSSQDRWKVFILLYEMLEEYGTHLVEAAWTHQVFLLVQSMPPTNNDLHVTCGAGQIQMETIEGIFSWLAVLWERGFFHDNPQVRCLIMESFLGIDWEKDGNCATKVPRSFVLGPLLLGLNDAVHHKDFGVNGIYTSRTIQGATKYLFNFSCQMSSRERVDFIWSLASLTRHESFGRAGLMCLAFCIASAACHTDSHNMLEGYNMGKSPENQQIESAQGFSLFSRDADLLDVLGFVIESSKQHFNPNYRLQVCEQVIKAASSVINTSSMPLGLLLHFLSTVPREFTDREGTLRVLVQQWLTQSNNVDKGFGLFATETCVQNGLVSFPMSFIRKNSPDCSFAYEYDDEDVEAWILEAQRWARMLFLVVREAQHLDPIFMFFQKYCSSLCNQDGIMEWVPIKLLILILSLVEELRIECTKCEIYNEVKVGRELNSTGKLHCSSFLLTSTDCVTIHGKFASLMIELVAFSKLVSPIFWSFSATMDTQLPKSLRGKLGGPSQRRLASSTTSSVLRAILSLRTVARVSSLCTRLRRDDHLDYSFTFLWDFCWKTIKSQGHNSETAAELRLAGYEALTSVFKEWSLSFTPSSYDFIMACNKSLFGAGEDEHLLDLLVNNFIHNVNDLLSNGVLTRSRRAVLMNWKWLCLDSLLSVPFNTVKNGIHIRNTNSFFSKVTLRSIFADIVESLENAGESSALYMLRSVRLLLGLLCSATISPKISSDPEVTCEMIEQLAHTSWILHLSCNKRRVAPIAALLSAVLHQSVFGDLRLHEANGRQVGPLKWFIGNLLAEGIKSPRTIRLAALHLTGLWLLHPKTVKYYIKELKLLSLYGSVAFDEDFEAELSENHEARTEVSLLAQSQDCELTEVFINTELYARVSVAVLFFKLANLASDRGHTNEDSLAALDCGKMFLLELLDFAVNDKDLAKELYKKYSAVHRRKVRAWQMICILSHFVEKDIVEEVTSNLHICLYRNNLPAVRQYLEMFTIQVYLRFPMLAKEQLIPIFHDQNMRPQALSSYVFIAANIIVHASEPQIQRKHLNDLLPPIIPFLTSHHHSLRGFTQLLVHYVLCKLWPALKADSSEDAQLERKCFEDLKLYLAENNDCKRLRKSMEKFLDAFDPTTCATPAGVFNARHEGSGFECVPVSLMEQVINFLNGVRDDLRDSIAKDAMTINNEALTASSACSGIEEPLDIGTKSESLLTSKDLDLDFQKKITLNEHLRELTNTDSNCFQANAKISRLLSEIEKEDVLLCPMVESRIRSMERIRGSQQELIIVASLLDRIPNLAGLARTCEVFKAAGLAVANTSILQDKQFQLISVTAEKWIPIIEVPVDSIKVYLEKKRREGFSIIGLEQTANSTSLDQYSFQNKTVLVLGREKEGIPVDIIHVLDACVEIPQLGIIRSLNVHVSGAIALWEYTRQGRSKQT